MVERRKGMAGASALCDQCVHQVLLGGAGGTAPRRLPLIGAISVKNPGVGIVFEVGAQPFVDHSLSLGLLQNGERDFDPSKEIAVHPVGAGEEDPVVAVVQEVKDPAVLKKPADDRTHPDMFRQPGDAGP